MEQKEIDNKGAAFIETIIALKNGAVLQDFGERLNVLVGAVRETARPGSLVLTVKVAPATPGNAEVVTVEAEVREKLPRPSLGKTVFFTTAENTLTRQNPSQLAMKLEMPA